MAPPLSDQTSFGVVAQSQARSKRPRCLVNATTVENNNNKSIKPRTRRNVATITKLEQITCSCNIDQQQCPQEDIPRTELARDDDDDDDDDDSQVLGLVARQAGGKSPLETGPDDIIWDHHNGIGQSHQNHHNHHHHHHLKLRKIVIQTLGLGDRNVCKKHMPWFGIDVGGSLVKVVFFDPRETTSEEFKTLQRIRQYLWSSKAYGRNGRRDAHLEMQNCLINGRLGSLHFLRFATSEMPAFLAMAKRKRFADDVCRTICATGGGACKFEEDIRRELGIRLRKTDEFDSIIHGIPYVCLANKRECYFLSEPMDETRCTKVPYDFSRPYPYLVVNIGSGVSILAVYSRERYSRISGSSLGGGTFLGLCCLLTQCETFDEAISLAVAGTSMKVNKLVKDIYGGDYPKFELSGDTVASAFGHMNLGARRKQVKREDLARALLEMVTNNIGSIARMCAVNHGIDRVVFIGNFLRANQLSMKLLSFAVDYWSKGAIKALFLEHEGYFGAVGCFVESNCPPPL